jgi:hypothetical protein
MAQLYVGKRAISKGIGRIIPRFVVFARPSLPNFPDVSAPAFGVLQSLSRPLFTVAQAKAGDARFRWSDNLVNFYGLIASQVRKLGFEVPRPFRGRFKRWRYRLHPAIEFEPNPSVITRSSRRRRIAANLTGWPRRALGNDLSNPSQAQNCNSFGKILKGLRPADCR